jgi:hypothetical protein
MHVPCVVALPLVDRVLDPEAERADLSVDASLDGRRHDAEIEQLVQLMGGNLASVAGGKAELVGPVSESLFGARSSVVLDNTTQFR